MTQVDHLLRDFRQNESTTMDRKLLLSLCMIQNHFIGSDNKHKRIEIISGYRSAKTNDMLRRQGSGVAKKSMHLTGQAIDFRIPGESIQNIFSYARHLNLVAPAAMLTVDLYIDTDAFLLGLTVH